MEVVVGGFKNVENIELSLDKFNSLVALNNYGKSNLLEAIEFGFEFINVPLEKKSKFMALRSLIPINKHIDDSPFKFEITFESKIGRKTATINYGFSFDWVKNNKRGQKIKEEFLRVKSDKTDKKFTTYLKRNTRESLYLTSSTGRCDKQIKVKRNELVVNKLLSFDHLFYSDVVEKLKGLSIPYIDTLQNPDKLFRRIPSKVVRTGYSLELPENYDVAYFIYSLKKMKPDLYEVFEDSIKSLLNDIDDFEPIEIDFKNKIKFEGENNDLPLDFPDKLYDIRVKEINNNQQSNIGSLSSGSQKMFYILAYTIAAELNKIPLISFEELENSIHPGLLQKLLIILDGLTENTKIITTSHSPYLIQYLDISKIKVGIPNDKGLAIFKEIKKSKFTKLQKMAEDEGVSVGDLIFDKIIECSNGDHELLNEMWE